jgi:catechol 2,3-dioxygenase-like lactoylglutathione lyase family enzyme
MVETMALNLQGLRTVIYPSPDLEAAKAWWTELLGEPPYFDEPFYVGFNVADYELGLLPDGDAEDGPLVYWGVEDMQAAFDEALEAGASIHEPPSDVGDGIITGSVISPQGTVIGFIFNPHSLLE